MTASPRPPQETQGTTAPCIGLGKGLQFLSRQKEERTRETFFFPITALVGLVIFTATLKAQQPRMATVEPDTAEVGDLVSVKGQEIDNANVDTFT